MAYRIMEKALTLVIGAAIVFMIIQPAILAVGKSITHSAECLSKPMVEDCHA